MIRRGRYFGAIRSVRSFSQFIPLPLLRNRISSFAGSCAIVTGAAGGIGAEIAKQLRAEGCGLVLVDRSQDGLVNVADALQRQFPQQSSLALRIHTVDLSDASRIDAFVSSIVHDDSTLRTNILINCAGIAPSGQFAHMDWATAESALRVNLVATVHLTHQLLPTLLARDNGGFIVNVASAAGFAGAGGLTSYCTSKFGLVGFSETLRVELRHRKIGVSVVCPAFVATSIVQNTLQGSATAGEKSELEVKRVEAIDKCVKMIGISPHRVAAACLAAMRYDRSVVLVGMQSRLFRLFARGCPSLLRLMCEGTFRLMKRFGFL